MAAATAIKLFDMLRTHRGVRAGTAIDEIDQPQNKVDTSGFLLR
jgi:hypothetical protein